MCEITFNDILYFIMLSVALWIYCGIGVLIAWLIMNKK